MTSALNGVALPGRRKGWRLASAASSHGVQKSSWSSASLMPARSRRFSIAKRSARVTHWVEVRSAA